MAVDDKVVIGQTHAADDAEAVLIGYLLGVEALRAGKQALMGLTQDGVPIATKGHSHDTVSSLPPRAPPPTSSCREHRRSRSSMPSPSTKAAGSSPAPCASRPT